MRRGREGRREGGGEERCGCEGAATSGLSQTGSCCDINLKRVWIGDSAARFCRTSVDSAALLLPKNKNHVDMWACG